MVFWVVVTRNTTSILKKKTGKDVVDKTFQFNPLSELEVKYIPAFVLQAINDKFLREPEQLYELQYSSLAIPPSLYNFQCYAHLEYMRESYAFVVYFVICDTLFCLIPIIVSVFSLVRFAQELQQSLDFQRKATLNSQGEHLNFWTVKRSVFMYDYVAFLLTLLSIISFSIYWLVVDPDAVFLFETAFYLNTYFIFAVSFYFTLRKLGLCANIFHSVLHTVRKK